MLVLTRKKDETVHLHTSDGLIAVTVVECNGRARLGFEAPDSVKILRKELEAQNLPAAHGQAQKTQ